MPPLIEAHRGDSSNAPENTIAAFALALRLGVASIELDIHPCKDGTLMVIHDDTVDRTTDGSGSVSDFTVEQLHFFDAGAKFSPEFKGERIPRLNEVLQLVANTSTLLNIEIKGSSPGSGISRAVVDHLCRFGKQGEYIVSSFELEALLAVRAHCSEVTLALLGKSAGILPVAERHHIPWIHAEHTTVSRETIARAHSGGIRVNVWTVDDPETLPYWQEIGVDKVCTNRPARMLGGILPPR
jgi:glycerophosphoryl diester phosphodiesterase